MTGYSNYPDDIRNYDGDPRSPFYDSSREDAIEEAEAALHSECPDLIKHCTRLGIEVEVKMSSDSDGESAWEEISYTLSHWEWPAAAGFDPEVDGDAIAEALARIDAERDDAAALAWAAL